VASVDLDNRQDRPPSPLVRENAAAVRHIASARCRVRRGVVRLGVLVSVFASVALAAEIGVLVWIAVCVLAALVIRPLWRVLLWRPFPGRLSGWRLPLRGPRRRRAERYVAHGHAGSALREYDLLVRRAERSDARLLADAAVAAYEAEQYQRCLDLARAGLTARSAGARRVQGRLHTMLALANMALYQRETAWAASADAVRLLGLATMVGRSRATHAVTRSVGFPPIARLAIMQADARGFVDQAVSAGFATATCALRRFRWLTAARLLVQVGDVLLRAERPADAAVCFRAVLRILDERYFGRDRYASLPTHSGWRPLIYVLVQAVSGEVEAELDLGSNTSTSWNRLSESPAYLELLERPLDLARLYQLCARYERRTGNDSAALDFLLKALDRVDRSRYDIRDPVKRVRWVRANLAAHRGALAIAYEQRDHSTVCELLEVARLQALPASIKDQLVADGTVEIPLHIPPRITIGGRAGLVDATGVPPDTDVIDLRGLLRQTRGEHAVLLSYWTNEDGCYWSLLGPDWVHSGRFQLDDSEVAATLAALAAALPNPRPGETELDRSGRVRTGPYYADRAGERRLAQRLAVLFPEPLLAHLRTHGFDQRVPLTICPAPELARVPWPLVAIGDAPSGDDAVRLLEVADIQLGLTSALTSHLIRASRSDYTTQVEIIVDPSGEGSDSAADLLGARKALRKVPGSVAVHGGRWRADGAPVTKARLAEILAAMQPGGSLLFVGHGVDPQPGRSTAEGALALAAPLAGGPMEFLTAATLLRPEFDEQALRFPSRVVLAACNTAGADQAEAGDWLGLVPAVHWCGAAEVVSSTVPVPDGALDFERSLLEWLCDTTEGSRPPLGHMLLRLQRDALQAWRAGGRWPPISWAFYLHSGIAPSVDGPVTAEDGGDATMIWTREAVALFVDAVEFAVAFRRRVMHPSCVALVRIGEEAFDEESLARALTMYAAIGWELINPFHIPVPFVRKHSARPSRSSRRLVGAAEQHARSHRRQYVIAADVLLALAGQHWTSGSWLVRRVSRIRHAAVRSQMLRVTHSAREAPSEDAFARLSPAEAGTLARLGFTSEWLRDNAAARRRVALDHGSKPAERGEVRREVRQYDDALGDLDRAVALNPDSVLAWYHRGEAHRLLGRHEEAIADFDRALRLDPDDGDSLESRGYSKRRLQRYDDALADFDRALTLKPDSAFAWYHRGLTHRLMGRHVEAIADFDQAVALNPDSVLAWYHRGETHRLLGRHEEAIADFDHALRLDPDDGDSLESRGYSKHRLQRYDDALADFDRALTLKPDSAFAWYHRGLTHRLMGRHAEAIADYDQALLLDPDDASTLGNRGASLRALGRQDEALHDLDRALQRDPASAFAWRERGYLRFVRDELAEAMTDLSRALEIDPSSAFGWRLRSRTLLALEQVARALEDVDSSLQLDDRSVHGWTLRGLCLERLEEHEAAAAAFERALAIDPHHEPAQEGGRRTG
jgi:tetratricopeptide (TPR) repeat protein